MRACFNSLHCQFRPILLKKLAPVSTGEKCAAEIEIRFFHRRFRSQI